MRDYRRYWRRPRYPYRRSFRRGIRIERGTLKFLALGIVLVVVAAILLHLAQ